MPTVQLRIDYKTKVIPGFRRLFSGTDGGVFAKLIGLKTRALKCRLGLPWGTDSIAMFDRLRVLDFPQTDVFLILFSIGSRVSFNNVKQTWVPEVSHHCPNVPIVIVGTNSHLRTPSVVRDGEKKQNVKIVSYEEGDQLAKSMGAFSYVECSAKAGINVSDPFIEVNYPSEHYISSI